MGAPIGNVNAAKNTRLVSDAISRILLQNDGKKLRAIASKIVTMAEKGDLGALKEVFDRCEGKVRQQIEHTGLNDGPIEIELGKRERARRLAFILQQGSANDDQARVAKEA